ncbi:hypothetical protein CVT24_009322 [Panaeolus cyanescens]|uniref:FHA domain-containing protein n=1 Tax=Panaeolus cyanescens TaxID=181874 RepID=A0A409Y888_9AGAR|nr:hypothetical protein CVT24_009322 [Panaeolus cyanescens]
MWHKKHPKFMESFDDHQASEAATVSRPYSYTQEYDPAYEWPGGSDDTVLGGSDLHNDIDEDQQLISAVRPDQPVFRLTVKESGILSKKQRIAVLDSFSEVQLGRDLQIDGSTIPRIRLKEMMVSKLHATIYWDGARKEWNVVDMGSVHGTFLKNGFASEETADPGVRLSGQRAASVPRQLRHLDQLTIGSTTFVVHIHKDERPCEECSISGRQGLSISLFPEKKGLKRSREAAGLDSESLPSWSVAGQERDPKKALSMLKRSLLTRHDISKHASTSTGSIEEARGYMDRAERRRMLFPATRCDSPGVPALSYTGSSSESKMTKSPTIVSESAPAIPLPASNIGHQLLLRQGWTPGEALGTVEDGKDDRIVLLNPLQVKSSKNRSGIGNK